MLSLTQLVPCVKHWQRRQGLRAELVEESEDFEQERCFRVRGHTTHQGGVPSDSEELRNRENTHCGLVVVISRWDHLTNRN